MSGGAPTLHLAAGALCGFHEEKVSFEAVAASGAGALPGLLYLAPRNPDPDPVAAALRGVVDMNVHDAIYDLIPNNFKVFFKYGPFSEPFYHLGQFIKRLVPPAEAYGKPYERLVHDWIDFVTAAVTPTTLTYRSKSVLTRVQIVNDLVDWDALPNSPKQFFLNAFNVDTQTLQVFTKDTMTPAAFYAGLAMPWLYPPTPARMDRPLYTEGASHDPSGIEAVLENGLPHMSKMDSIVVLETISPDLWTDPESIYEALELTIMDPIVTLGENVAALYALQEMVLNPVSKMPRIYRLPFVLPKWEGGKLLEWSYSNAVTLWDAGHDAALKFCDDLSKATAIGPIDAKYRYFQTLQEDSRQGDFLKLFDNPFKSLMGIPVPPPPGS